MNYHKLSPHKLEFSPHTENLEGRTILFYSCGIMPAIYLKNVWPEKTRTGLSLLLEWLSHDCRRKKTKEITEPFTGAG